MCKVLCEEEEEEEQVREQFSSLEEVIRLDFIPAISGRAVSDIERVLLALPARRGGLGLPNPASDADVLYLCLGTLPKHW